MPVELPIDPSIPFQTFSTTLDGIQFGFEFFWNARADRDAGAWFFHLYTADDELIRASIKVSLGTLLGGRCADARMPNGVFKAIDLSDTDGLHAREAKLDDLGTSDNGGRVVIYFFTIAELGAL